jgi:hypothetical protein
MSIAFEEPCSSVIGLHHGAAGANRLAGLFLRGLILCASVYTLGAEPTPATFVDIFNAFNQRNEIGYDEHSATIVNGQLVVRKTPGMLLPLLPSFGLSWEF